MSDGQSSSSKVTGKMMKGIPVLMISYVIIMSLLSLYLEKQHFFQTSVFIQHFLISVFAGGEVFLILLFTYFSYKNRIIVLRR